MPCNVLQLSRYAAAAVSVFWFSIASGAEGAGGHEETKGIFSGDIFSSLFSIVLFVLLLLILRKWAWGPILDGLKKRENHIGQSIEIAKKNREEARQLLTDYEKKLASARDESEAILAQGRDKAIQVMEQMRHQATEDAKILRSQAQREIALARDRALRRLYDETAMLSTDLAGRILHRELSPEDHRQLIQEALSQLREGTTN